MNLKKKSHLISFRIFHLLFLIIFLFLSFLLMASGGNAIQNQQSKVQQKRKPLPSDSIKANISLSKKINLYKDFLYNKHTLKDEYMYGKIKRKFQWDKIEEKLIFVDSIQRKKNQYGILQNYKNKNGQPPLAKGYKKDAYNRIADKYGTERTQAIPLYLKKDTITPERYANDGIWVKVLNDTDTLSNWVSIETLSKKAMWLVPRNYLKKLNDTIQFKHVIIIDVKNQNITTLEKIKTKWFVRSMNPATTGKHNPPHKQETPLGMFVLQDKRNKMFYLVDGTQDIAGFAPYASRFSMGGYIHGIPLVNPNTELVEYSWSLGTTPRSHMCVRNATSHAKFIYDWAPSQKTLIFVID